MRIAIGEFAISSVVYRFVPLFCGHLPSANLIS
jgi:hypothetical protein